MREGRVGVNCTLKRPCVTGVVSTNLMVLVGFGQHLNLAPTSPTPCCSEALYLNPLSASDTRP